MLLGNIRHLLKQFLDSLKTMYMADIGCKWSNMLYRDDIKMIGIDKC